jgi:hypothetical protein
MLVPIKVSRGALPIGGYCVNPNGPMIKPRKMVPSAIVWMKILRQLIFLVRSFTPMIIISIAAIMIPTVIVA